MNHWLVKSEPDEWSWDEHWSKKGRVEPWTGVRNHQAKQNLIAMKKGDRAFFHHSGKTPQIVGILEVVRASHPDPTDDTGKWVSVDFKAIQPAKHPVALADIRQTKTLAGMVLVKNSRLSVQPVTAAQWKTICKMAGMKP